MSQACDRLKKQCSMLFLFCFVFSVFVLLLFLFCFVLFLSSTKVSSLSQSQLWSCAKCGSVHSNKMGEQVTQVYFEILGIDVGIRMKNGSSIEFEIFSHMSHITSM